MHNANMSSNCLYYYVISTQSTIKQIQCVDWLLIGIIQVN